ncbi:MAG: AAA family ATPase [Candidatus Aenigmarchaeota archaeon]|nr:AAA family ATPase [Candidatus Aenigmarchaeota archaeon]
MVKLERMVLQNFKSFGGKTAIPFTHGFTVIAGPNGSGKSCRSDTEVMLSDGSVRQIGELVESNLQRSKVHVQLDDGIYTPENIDDIGVLGLDIDNMTVVEKDISAFIRRTGEPELYKIVTKTGRSVTTTGCHPVMIFSGNKIHSEVVNNLNKRDFIATPRIIRLDRKEKIKFKEIDVDEDFARLMGYLVGDGYATFNRIEIVNQDNLILEDFENLARKFGLKVKYRKKVGNAIRVICWSKDFPLLLKDLFRSESVNKLTTLYKNIPPEVMVSDSKVLASFLAALFDCDATIRKDNPTFEFTSKNEKLADQVQLALLRFGIVARKEKKAKCATNTKNKIKRDYYYIIIEGKEKLKLLYENIPLRCGHKKERLQLYAEKNITGNPNIDVVPQEANLIIKKCVQLLGIKYKPMRKKHPYFAAYIENRCCPSREGVKKTLNILNERVTKIKEVEKQLKTDKKIIMTALRDLNMPRPIPSKAIGLHRDTVNNWACGRKPAQKNLEKLHDFIKSAISEKKEKSENLLKTLEKLADSDIFWDQIASIEKMPGDKYVYDLTIPNCHNFIGNGIFVHNSNVIDAMTFVLGTSTAKSIRAQKLQNLIFNGGVKRKQADSCEVSLYLDNSDGKIPGEEKEIKIARHVTRSGISSYKINGRSVTKAKVIDFLANANLSPDGYNIIMQGDVTRIIELSPKERREIIDEISGITEFNQKKELAIAKIEKVESRVREAMIIISEKQKRVSQLKTEKENAEKYIALDTELKTARASLLHTRLDEARNDIEKIDSAVDEYSKQLDETDKMLRKTESDLDKKESMIKERGEKIIEKKDVEIVRSVERLRSEIMRKRDQISFRDMEIDRLGRSVRDLTTRLPHPTTLFTSTIRVPEQYSSAIEVAVGSHAKDLVVESDEIAARCIKYMKEKHIRRARFLPLNKIRPRKSGRVPKEAIGLAINIINYDDKFAPVVEYVLGNTLIVENIDVAKKISDRYEECCRMSTLDGDLVEVSGAIIGGYYEKTRKFDLERLKTERQSTLDDIEAMEEELAKLRALEDKEKKDVTELSKERNTLEQEIFSMKKSRKDLIDQKFRKAAGDYQPLRAGDKKDRARQHEGNRGI